MTLQLHFMFDHYLTAQMGKCVQLKRSESFLMTKIPKNLSSSSIRSISRLCAFDFDNLDNYYGSSYVFI